MTNLYLKNTLTLNIIILDENLKTHRLTLSENTMSLERNDIY